LLPLELSVEGRELSHELGGQPLEELALTSGHHPLDRCFGLLVSMGVRKRGNLNQPSWRSWGRLPGRKM